MTTTVYQKFVSKYAETFTLIEITDGADYTTNEIVPTAKVAKLDEDELVELLEELRDSKNEKASWSDGEEDFDEEDARAAYHQKWDEIDSNFDNTGI
jgi:hypothetical protein